MKKCTKIWLFIATALTVAGLIMFGVIMTMLKWDFTKLSTDEFETNTYTVSEPYGSVSVNTVTADVTFIPSENGETKVVCYEEVKVTHSVTVKDDTLVIEVNDQRKWYDHIGIHFTQPKLTVYLPAGEYGALSVKLTTGDIMVPQELRLDSMSISATTGDIKSSALVAGVAQLKTTTGDIAVENCSIGALDMTVTTGDISVSAVTCEGKLQLNVGTGDAKLTDTSCKSLISDGTTGDLYLKNVIAVERFTIERTTGNIKLERCDAAELYVNTTTGDVTGSLLSEKIFIANATTGDVRVPESVSGGKCKITTTTGDILINIQ